MQSVKALLLKGEPNRSPYAVAWGPHRAQAGLSHRVTEENMRAKHEDSCYTV